LRGVLPLGSFLPLSLKCIEKTDQVSLLLVRETGVGAVVIKIHRVKQGGRLAIVEIGRAGHLALNEVGGRVMRAVASAAIPIRIRKSRDGSRCCQAAGRGRANNGASLSSGPVLALLTVSGPGFAFIFERPEGRPARKHSRPRYCRL
jgi:hypothetical protein